MRIRTPLHGFSRQERQSAHRPRCATSWAFCAESWRGLKDVLARDGLKAEVGGGRA